VTHKLKELLDTIRSGTDLDARTAAGIAQLSLSHLHKLKVQAVALIAVSKPRRPPLRCLATIAAGITLTRG